MQGFKGFRPAAPVQPQAPGRNRSIGGRVFEQLQAQLRQTHQAQQTQNKSKVDMLWPLGTIMKGKHQ